MISYMKRRTYRFPRNESVKVRGLHQLGVVTFKKCVQTGLSGPTGEAALAVSLIDVDMNTEGNSFTVNPRPRYSAFMLAALTRVMRSISFRYGVNIDMYSAS